MAKNTDLNKAAKAKKDEFYTQLTDIEKEIRYYRDFFRGKVVFCNCDDPFESNFFKYFAMNFNPLGLKKLIATCYVTSPVSGTEMKYYVGADGQLSFASLADSVPIPAQNERKPYRVEITEVTDVNGDGRVDLADVEYLLKNTKNSLTLLNGDGDFRSPECLEFLKQADVVVTNPPFSLFREFIAQLIQYEKYFLIIGNINAVTYKEVFPLIMQNKVWLGASIHSGDREFRVPDSYPLNASGYRVDENGTKYIRVKGVRWFTNIDYAARHEDIILYKHYTSEEYPHYDNYDAIEVSKTAEIPCDYFEEMGVPKGSYETGGPRFYLALDKLNRMGDNLDRTEQNRTEQNRTEQNRTEQNRTEQNRTEVPPTLRQNCYPSQDVMASWECRSHSLTDTTPTNLNLLEQQRAKERDSQRACGVQPAGLHSQLSVECASIRDCLSSTSVCSGIMGVPITFLDKYNPDQFEIIGMAKRGAGDPALKTKVYTKFDYPNYSDLNATPVIIQANGVPKNTYPRILIRRKRVNTDEN